MDKLVETVLIGVAGILGAFTFWLILFAFLSFA